MTRKLRYEKGPEHFHPPVLALVDLILLGLAVGLILSEDAGPQLRWENSPEFVGTEKAGCCKEGVGSISLIDIGATIWAGAEFKYSGPY